MNKLIQLLAFLFIILTTLNVYAGASDDVNTSSEDFETSVYEDEIYELLSYLCLKISCLTLRTHTVK